jgi:hypothetical protein
MQRDAAASLARGGRSSRWSRTCQHCLTELARAVAQAHIHTHSLRHGLAKDPILARQLRLPLCTVQQYCRLLQRQVPGSGPQGEGHARLSLRCSPLLAPAPIKKPPRRQARAAVGGGGHGPGQQRPREWYCSGEAHASPAGLMTPPPHFSHWRSTSFQGPRRPSGWCQSSDCDFQIGPSRYSPSKDLSLWPPGSSPGPVQCRPGPWQ